LSLYHGLSRADSLKARNGRNRHNEQVRGRPQARAKGTVAPSPFRLDIWKVDIAIRNYFLPEIDADSNFATFKIIFFWKHSTTDTHTEEGHGRLFTDLVVHWDSPPPNRLQ